MPSAGKGKPSGKYAESKISPGRKGDYKRSGWPEDATTQRVDNAAVKETENETAQISETGEGRGRDRKAGSPV